MPPDLIADLLVDLPRPRLRRRELVALVVGEDHGVLVVFLHRLVAEAVPRILVVLVFLAEDLHGRMGRLRVDELEVVLVANVHAAEEDADSPGHVLRAVPSVFPPLGVQLPPPRTLLSQVADEQVRNDGPLRESDEHVERALFQYVLHQILHHLWDVVVLDVRRGVELHVFSQTVRLPPLLVTRVHVPVLELGAVRNLFLHRADGRLPFEPSPILGPLDVRPVRVVLSQRAPQPIGLELHDSLARVAAAEGEHAQLPAGHVLQVLEERRRRLGRDGEPPRHPALQAALVAHLGHEPLVDLLGPRVARARQLVALRVQQHQGALVVVLTRLSSGCRSLVEHILVVLPENVRRGVLDLRGCEGGGEAIVSDAHASEEDAAPPRHRAALAEQLRHSQVDDDGALEESHDDVHGAFLFHSPEKPVRGLLSAVVGDLDPGILHLEEVDPPPGVVRVVREPGLELAALGELDRHGVRVVIVDALDVPPGMVALQDSDVHLLPERRFEAGELEVHQVLVRLAAVQDKDLHTPADRRLGLLRRDPRGLGRRPRPPEQGRRGGELPGDRRQVLVLGVREGQVPVRQLRKVEHRRRGVRGSRAPARPGQTAGQTRQGALGPWGSGALGPWGHGALGFWGSGQEQRR
mmetsp:Transcript_51965/g.137252  ORF Transcript_51965/g.137252 Transcript_51965/m.137252 type:complete len:636 (-) Transcript_51965:54-1961(-)